MKNNTGVRLLLFLMVLLGLGAIFGGAMLILSPSGKAFGMPLGLLTHTPFHSFLVPGIVLFSLLGVFPSITAYALFKRTASKIGAMCNCYPDMHWAWTFCIYTGFALIGWIQIEMMLLRAVHWSHTLYMFWATAIIFVALLPQVRNACRKQVASEPT